MDGQDQCAAVAQLHRLASRVEPESSDACAVGLALSELARLTRERDEARRAAHDTAPLRARAEQAEAERDALKQIESAALTKVTDLTAERDRLREAGERLLRSQPAAADAHPDGSSSLTYSASEWEEMVQACAAMRAALRGEEGES